MASPESTDDPLEPPLSPLFLSAIDSGSNTSTSTSSSSNSSSHDADSPCNDWSLPPAMWSQYSDPKAQVMDDLNLGLFPSDQWSMDIDTDISSFISDTSHQFSIDPNALHFGNNVYGAEQDRLADSIFQFTVSGPFDSSSNDSKSSTSSDAQIQQLPTPTAASPSSRSASPDSSFSNTGVNPSDLLLLTQLSQRARDATGVTHAITASAASLLQAEHQTPITPVSPVLTDSQIPQPKLPIPRLRPNTLPVTNTNSTQQHRLAPILSPDALQTQAQIQAPAPIPAPSPLPAAPQLTKSGRPKTSHTTIERRYRTNLNARILALRRAVPALRILEKGVTQTQQGKGLTGASAPKWDFNDVINERGYVDGVKAAKKNSKGVVLGKAVEYIKALKRRELRLTRETDGLKSLLCGLVGGPELLHTWEQEWRTKFGGEEADEVDEEGDDDDDEEGEDDDDDDGGGRSRKKSKVERQVTMGAGANSTVAPAGGEKRKRGRPRKAQIGTEAPRLVLHPPGLGVQPQAQQAHQQSAQQPQPSKYLLAAFVLFNFFNTAPTSSNADTNIHPGVVLNPTPTASSNSSTYSKHLASIPTAWTPLQIINTLISVLLLISLASGYLPQRIRAYVPGFVFAQPPTPRSEKAVNSDAVEGEEGSEEDVDVDATEEPARNDTTHLASGTLGGLVKAVVRRVLSSAVGKGKGIDKDEVNVWRGLAEGIVLRGHSTPLIKRIQTYLSFSIVLRASSTTSTVTTTTSASDDITLALLALPFSSSTAEKRWNKARKVATSTAVEKLALGMGVEAAAEVVMGSSSQVPASTQTQIQMFTSSPISARNQSPAQRIASYVVLLRTKDIAAKQFVSCVNIDGATAGGIGVDDAAQIQGQGQGQNFEQQAQHRDSTLTLTRTLDTSPVDVTAHAQADDTTVLQAGKELGGRLADLTAMIEKCSVAVADAESPGPGPNSVGAVTVVDGNNVGTRMSSSAVLLYPYSYELENIMEETESESGNSNEEEGGVDTDAVDNAGADARKGKLEDMVRDAKLLVMAAMLYRYIFAVSNAAPSAVEASFVTPAAVFPTTATVGFPTPPALPTTFPPALTLPTAHSPSHFQPPATMLLALRRALASTAFDLTPDTEDARDRIVDILADMGKGAGRVGVC